MTRPAPKRDIPSDLTPQISKKLKSARPCASGSFSDVYRFTIETSEGTKEVAVKAFKIDPGRAVEKYKKAMGRELNVWLRLSKHQTIVPILGIAHVGFPLPVLVSQWMPSGTLDKYLDRGTITASEKVELARGVADGLMYLHSENVVHGDLHPGNVLIDGSRNPRLTDFGLATVVGDPDLQWGATTAACELSARWHAPEAVGFGQEDGPARPDFKSDIYSFGGVMFFIVSGDIPWKEKKQPHIIIALSNKVAHPRPDNILNKHWNLIQKCWCWDPWDRPKVVDVLGSLRITGLDIEDNTITDFTFQISAMSKDEIPSAGTFGIVYRRTIESSEGTMEVAVKIFKIGPQAGRTMQKINKGINRELRVWLRLRHPSIVSLLGIANLPDSPFPALISEWISSGTLHTYLKEQGTISASTQAKLARGIADGLEYLHSRSVVHGDLCPGNVLVDGSGHPRLTDFGLATVAGDVESQLNTTTAGRSVNPQWRAPEVIGIDPETEPVRPNFESDVYSFGSVMFFIVSGVTPWHEKKSSYHIIIELSKGATPTRPDNILDEYWNLISKCWSRDPMHRPEATEVTKCIATQIAMINSGEIETTDKSDNLQGRQPKSPSQGLASRNSPSRAASSTSLTRHIFSSVSTLSLSEPFNVLIFGENGVGKSSVIDLIMGRGAAQTPPDQEIPTLTYTPYEVNLGTHRFKLWEVPSIESIGFFRTLFSKWHLKKAYKRLCKDDGVYLLLYCMRGSKAQSALVRDYKSFTDIVSSTTGPGRIPVVAVVTSLEDYPRDMDNWWTYNRDNLERFRMRFSAHACITSLPDDPHASPAMRGRRQRSEDVIRSLLYQSYQMGSTLVNSSVMTAS